MIRTFTSADVSFLQNITIKIITRVAKCKLTANILYGGHIKIISNTPPTVFVGCMKVTWRQIISDHNDTDIMLFRVL